MFVNVCLSRLSNGGVIVFMPKLSKKGIFDGTVFKVFTIISI
jgi:hypothetical protein